MSMVVWFGKTNVVGNIRLPISVNLVVKMPLERSRCGQMG